MTGSLEWYPIAYDVGPPTNELSDIPWTEIEAPGFPDPHEFPGRAGKLDGLAFAQYVLDLLVEAGRNPEAMVWSAVRASGSSGVHLLIFEQRRIFRVGVLSDSYDRWLAGFAAEDASRFAAREIAAPERWFFGAECSPERLKVETIGSLLYNGEVMNQAARAAQYESDLHGWLRAAGPRLWYGQDDGPTKEAFIAAAEQGASGRTVAVDEEKLAETYRNLLVERGQEHRDGAADADFARFAEVAGFDLPSDLKTVLRIADGCYLGAGYCDFLSTSEIVTAWERQNRSFEGSTLASLTTGAQRSDSRTLQVDMTPMWIPVTDHKSGMYVGIDLLPGAEGVRGQLICYDLGETGAGAVVIASDLLNFFEQEIAAPLVNIDLFGTGEFDEDEEEEIEWVEESWILVKAYQERAAAPI